MAILSLLTNPKNAIMEAKEKRSWGSVLLLLFSISLIIALSVMLFSAYQQSTRGSYYYYGSSPGVDVGNVLLSGGLAFAASLLGLLFGGFLVKVATTTLGGVGGFLEGVTAEVFSVFAPVVTMLLGIVFMMGVLSVPIAVYILGPLTIAIVLYGLVLGYSTYYRAIKELFNTDMITAFVAASVMSGILLVLIYLTGMLSTMMMPFHYMM